MSLGGQIKTKIVHFDFAHVYKIGYTKILSFMIPNKCQYLTSITMLTPEIKVFNIIVDIMYLIPCNHLYISPILVYTYLVHGYG